MTDETLEEIKFDYESSYGSPVLAIKLAFDLRVRSYGRPLTTEEYEAEKKIAFEYGREHFCGLIDKCYNDPDLARETHDAVVALINARERNDIVGVITTFRQLEKIIGHKLLPDND